MFIEIVVAFSFDSPSAYAILCEIASSASYLSSVITQTCLGTIEAVELIEWTEEEAHHIIITHLVRAKIPARTAHISRARGVAAVACRAVE